MAMPIFVYSKVKPLRQAKGLNQAEIAAELGISRPTYVLMEQGGKEPTVTQLYTLARLLGVEAGELCTNLPAQVTSVSDYPKYKEIVLACVGLASNDRTVTKTKLSVLTYLIDFTWYAQNSRPMSGVTYRCMSRGPVADEYFRALDELYEAQAIALEPSGTSLLIRPMEARPAKLLDTKELGLIEAICNKWRPESTEAIVQFAQQQAPCQAAKSGDTIPYEAILNEPKESLY